MIGPIVDCVQFAPAISRARQEHRRVRGSVGHDRAQRVLARGPRTRGRVARQRSIRLDCARSAANRAAAGFERIGSHAALLHDQGVRASVLIHVRDRAVKSRSDLRALGGKQLPGNFHGLQHGGRDRTHQRVLGFIGDTGLRPPGDNQQLRQPKGPSERGERTDRITQPGILHHGDTASVRRARIARKRHAGNERHCIAFVRHRHIVQGRVLQDIVDERRQKGTGHAGIPAKSSLRARPRQNPAPRIIGRKVPGRARNPRPGASRPNRSPRANAHAHRELLFSNRPQSMR